MFGDGKQTEKEGNVTGNVYVKPQKTTGTLPRNPYLEAAAASSPVDVYEELRSDGIMQDPVVLDDTYEVVVAIDFGTAASGYSYSYKNNKEEIFMNKNWGAEMGVGCWKAPTCIAVKTADRKFLGFGFTAQAMYLDDPDNVELYREFKMQLAGQNTLGRHMVVKNEYKSHRKGDHEMSAVKVFSSALTFLKNHYLDILQNAGKDMTLDQIRWVLTVPALWTDEQKYFMREVAVEAGLIRNTASEQLIIALEPECASLYCRTIKAHLFDGASGNEAMTLPLGSQYMVLDCGGGTIDITIHKVTGPESSEEVFQPSGLTVGGTNINKNFELLLEKVLGPKFVEYCLQTDPSVWLELLVDFEQKKKNVSSQFDKHLDLDVKLGFSECFSTYHNGQSLKDYLQHIDSDKVSFIRSGKLRILPEAIKDDIFLPVISNIINHLKKLFQHPNMNQVEIIFMVGGFGQCKALQEEVRNLFIGEEVRVLIPEEPSLCILKGAVKFGHQPQFISSRISRWTYALLVSRAFDPRKDSKDRKVSIPGCSPYVEFLTPIIVKGESVKLNSVKEKVVQPRIPDQTEVDLAIYSSTEMKVDNPTGKGVKKLGDITVQVPISSNIKDREVTVELIFGGTELKVRGVTSSGHTMETKLDLLH